MSEHAILSAEPRKPSEPKGHQLRKSGRIPGVYYNAKHEVKHVSFDTIELGRLLRKETAVIDLRVSGQTLPCVIREVQRHPVFGEVLHVDLMGVDLSQSIRVRVPVHAVGVSYGVKTENGILDVILYELEIECLPDAMPSHIDVDVTNLHIGDAVRIQDVSIDGITVHGDPQSVIAHVSGKKAELEAEAGAGVEGATAEPEVIREKKQVEE